jgi:phage tail sheath protein FI
MSSPTYPGVYVQEVSSGVRPIEAVGTSTPAFLGLAERGPAGEARRVTSWAQYEREYGSFIADGYLAQSVLQFFRNGGRQCYVVAVRRADAVVASTTVQNALQAPGLRFSAAGAGEWGNALMVSFAPGSRDPHNEVRIVVRRQADPRIVPSDVGDLPADEVHDNLSLDPDARNYLPTVLRSASEMVRVEVLTEGLGLTRGTLRGGRKPLLPLEAPATGRRRTVAVNVDHDGWQDIDLAAVATTADAAEVAAEIQEKVRALTPKKASTPAEAFTGFTCEVEDAASGRLLLGSGTGAGAVAATGKSAVLVRKAAAADAAGMLGLLEVDGAAARGAFAGRRPSPELPTVQIGDHAVGGAVSDARRGVDGVADPDFVAAFGALDTITDVSLLAVPGECTADIVSAGMAYCAARPLQDLFFLGETGRDHVDVDAAKRFVASIATPNSYGAVYFPWLTATDPGGAAEPVLLPPSGYVAGLYARTDAARGVWKAPAGTAASLTGAVGLAVELTDTQHGILNPLGVNVIRRFPAAGIVSFGARTVSADPEWRSVPVRRMSIMLRTSIYQGIQWAVFEPNDEPLWSQLRLNIRSFMTTLFRRGAFQGTTPSDAFFVACDATTTTQADIDAGIVNVLVGFAPLRPAEFVLVKISQKAGQAS